MIAARDRIVAALICVLVSAITLGFSTRQGLNRDEAYYMMAGERYVQYYVDVLDGRLKNPLSDAAIWPYWTYNIEHPPLMKVLYGVSWRALHRCTCAADRQWHPDVARITSGHHTTLALMSEITAFRLPTAGSFGLLCALVYLFFAEALGSRWGAWAAALLMFAQPRAFFHAQTAGFDLPVATLCRLKQKAIKQYRSQPPQSHRVKQPSLISLFSAQATCSAPRMKLKVTST